MHSSWQRFLRLNAAFFIRQLEALIPGAAKGGLIIFHTKGAARMGEITVEDTEATLKSSHKFFDSEGSETTSKTVPTVESSDEAVVLPIVSDDGTTATYEVGHPGSAVVTVKGTGEDEGGNDVELISTGLVNVTAGPAVVGSVEFKVGEGGVGGAT